ncbi:uncharacterized protein A1O5_13104 [Cladophialophora psammophila CBS 110553]|uniref:Uncharacterized protein n=1 Tax=Cladophialophora psammophila CBS 110553 TaxID=1182543 RepID=W9VDG5_9EURO|nr:uncharacterized protein A1O5_13104 [Cladophialophora psammophila CBS 110553]EXJ53652.1 hypothetical protein A1O5_13104 [Cladophialophora psammophila CBS 110553]
MASFDLTRVQPGQYHLYDAASALSFQAMVEDLLNVVRTNEADFDNRDTDLALFFKILLGSQEAWQLATHVVPEFRYPQVLPTVKNKRPAVPYHVPQSQLEKEALQRRYRNLIEYAWE